MKLKKEINNINNMFDYLDKFNDLSPELKSVVSSAGAVTIIDSLEKEYNIDLASLIMRVMIKEFSINSLPLILFSEFKLSQDKAESLAKTLKKDIFSDLSSYLDFLPEEDLVNDINNLPEKEEAIIKEDDINEEKLSPAPESEKLKDEHNKKISIVALKILEILKFKFENNEIEKKFLLILDKYIRGVKDKFATREILLKDLLSGGFGISEKMVDNIFMISEEIKNKEYKKAKDDLKVENNILGKIEKLSHGKIFSETNQILLAPEDFSHKIAPLKPEIIDHNVPMVVAPNSLDSIPEVVENKKVDDYKKEELFKKDQEIEKNNLKVKAELDSDFAEILNEIQEEDILNPRLEIKNKLSNDNNGKIKMTDVKRVKITGPVDELKYMDLVNFRRLSENPEESFSKLSQKLQVLEEIDYAKMLEGIKAWRQSPINRLYLKIFSQASEDGITIDESIEKLKQSGKDYLKKEEIDALVNFNKSLIF